MNIINQFTWRNLKKNKVRTLVTILGIVLSTAMFVAVTEGAVSVQRFLVQDTIMKEGAWEISCKGFTEENATKLEKTKGIAGIVKLHNLGYMEMKEKSSRMRPYLCVSALEGDYAEYLPEIQVLEGRMPKNSLEIILPRRGLDSGNYTWKVGDTITLPLGTRYFKGEKQMGQETNVSINDKNEVVETLENIRSYKFSVVGICEQPSFEYTNAPGYSAFTIYDHISLRNDSKNETGNRMEGVSVDTYMKVKDLGEAADIVEALQKQFGDTIMTVDEIKYHRALLLFMGKTANRKFNKIMSGIAGLMIAVIMVASISLIYNAFAISMSERTKMFGLLKSMGATKKQIRNSVFFESACLCSIGIPIGIVSGLIGIGITLNIMGRLFLKVMGEKVGNLEMGLALSAPAILLAALLTVLTVMISAMLPAMRAIRMPVIEALQQNRDIVQRKSFRKRSRRQKTNRWSYRLFGFEGTLAGKNFQRNKKKQRTIVRSLAISMILFLTVTTFTTYLEKSAGIRVLKFSNDISVAVSAGNSPLTIQEADKGIQVADKMFSGIEKVKKRAYAVQIHGVLLSPVEALAEGSSDGPQDSIREAAKAGIVATEADVNFIEDEVYQSFLKESGLEGQVDQTATEPVLIYDDTFQGIHEDGSYFQDSYFGKKGLEGTLWLMENKGSHMFNYFEQQEDGSVEFTYENMELENDGEQQEEQIQAYPAEEAGARLEYSDCVRLQGDFPLGPEFYEGTLSYVNIFLPYSALQSLPKDFMLSSRLAFGFKTDEHLEVAEKLDVCLEELSMDKDLSEIAGDEGIGTMIYNNAGERETVKSLILMLRIISYGFIILISLIVAANVFHTISTSIILRRQEFAMLCSIGMSRKEMLRLMNIECLYYGIKGLFIGIPLSVVICYVMHHMLKGEFEFPFFMPAYAFVVVIGMIFAIMFLSMLYSMSRMKKENPIETLRNEVI